MLFSPVHIDQMLKCDAHFLFKLASRLKFSHLISPPGCHKWYQKIFESHFSCEEVARPGAAVFSHQSDKRWRQSGGKIVSKTKTISPHTPNHRRKQGTDVFPVARIWWVEILLEIPWRISMETKIYNKIYHAWAQPMHGRFLKMNRESRFEGGHRPKIEIQGSLKYPVNHRVFQFWFHFVKNTN